MVCAPVQSIIPSLGDHLSVQVYLSYHFLTRFCNTHTFFSIFDTQLVTLKLKKGCSLCNISNVEWPSMSKGRQLMGQATAMFLHFFQKYS